MFKRIIARLDCKNSFLVKGISLEGLRVIGNPKIFANEYFSQGVDEIHYQDVVASLYNRNTLDEIIETTTKNIFVIISVGGGIRSEADIDKVLRLGADKVSINSAALKDKNLLRKVVDKYGSSTISINIETNKINGKYEVLTESGREKSGVGLFNWIEEVQKIGVGEIIVTSIFYEGKRKGFDIQLYKKLKKEVSVPLLAHGGAGSYDHVLELFKECDVDGVLLASMLHYDLIKKIDKDKNLKEDGSKVFIKNFSSNENSSYNIKDLKKFLVKNNINVRYEN